MIPWNASTRPVDGRDPVVLIGSHVQFCQNISGLSNLKHLDVGGVIGIDLVVLVAVIN